MIIFYYYFIKNSYLIYINEKDSHEQAFLYKLFYVTKYEDK